VGTFNDLLSRLDADDRVKGKQFEHICKWFLTNDPLYKAPGSVVCGYGRSGLTAGATPRRASTSSPRTVA
jgi:hypothetical protein